jgi:hypothetical protein
MGCCGEKRTALRTGASVDPAERAVRPFRAPRHEPTASDVVVEYRGDVPMLLRGRATGRLYTFSPIRRVRSLPRRDASQLLRNRLFGARRTGDETLVDDEGD